MTDNNDKLDAFLAENPDIEVFEVMAISGSGNPRSMASGVSKATVPTMAGMVAALSGVAMSAFLENKARREREFIADELIIEHG